MVIHNSGVLGSPSLIRTFCEISDNGGLPLRPGFHGFDPCLARIAARPRSAQAAHRHP
jgi:hypothetical protein